MTSGPCTQGTSAAFSLHLDPALALLSLDPPVVGAVVCRPHTHPSPPFRTETLISSIAQSAGNSQLVAESLLEIALSCEHCWSRQGYKCLAPLPRSGTTSAPKLVELGHPSSKGPVASVEASDVTESQLIFSCYPILLPSGLTLRVLPSELLVLSLYLRV